MNHDTTKFVFFGSSEFSVYVLEELLLHGLKPILILTTPDKPQGRKLVLTPNIVKTWAKDHNIEVLDPSSLKPNTDSGQKTIAQLSALNSELFLVASYGKIIPKEIFEIPKRKTLNIHPSLLPKYRGASPIQSQILEDEKKIGVSIMQIEETMDTGPIIVQKKITPLAPLTLRGESENTHNDLLLLGRIELEKKLAIEGARLFAHIYKEWLAGAINPIIQNEAEATYCQKIEKQDGLLVLTDDPYKNLLKIKAFEEWPQAYCFLERNGKKIRVTIKEAEIENGQLKIKRVVPEGKKEMSYEDFLRGQR